MGGKRKARAPPAADATAAAAALMDYRLLAHILLRLRSPAALARTATVCRRWRRVASSPTFLRLFRQLHHPPPLLGFFVCNDGFAVSRSTVDSELVGKFEVILVTYYNMWEPRLYVFSSRSGQWTVHAYIPMLPMLSAFSGDMHANGSIYWLIDDDDGGSAYLLALDARTKQFSNIKLLSSMRTRYDGNMRVIRSDDGELRVVVAFAAAAARLEFWHLDKSRSCRGRWVLESRVELAHVDGVMELCVDADDDVTRIMDAGEGFVFLKHYGSEWVFALDLQAMVLFRLPHRRYYFGPALPYRMVLKPPLPASCGGRRRTRRQRGVYGDFVNLSRIYRSSLRRCS
uniref:Uncharacterized protein n=1 Tax=Oryza meridionalis TaxID=40149 RepID=A0A0E0EWA9_9ORYZ